jgi:3-polyprenyl-4-hydroxybenzoate decarboxylase
MAFDSFRDFINALERAGELKRIARPVATERLTFSAGGLQSYV